MADRTAQTTSSTNRINKRDTARVVWESKPRRAPNPKDIEFQTAEIVFPNPASGGDKLQSFFPLKGELIERSSSNRLIWGDNLLAMQALLASGYEGQINLIYIDPPFWTGENYYANIAIGGETITKSPSIIERLAYKDYWEGGVDSYLDMLFPRLQLMRRLLAENGIIFIHTDWHVGHYVKLIADEIFGLENFVSEIVWKRLPAHSDANHFGIVHDTIYEYSKGDKPVFNPQVGKWNEEYLSSHFKQDNQGNWYTLGDLTAPSHGRPTQPMKFGDKMITPPKGRMWAWTQENIDKMYSEGRIVFNEAGSPRIKRYRDERAGPAITSIWNDIPPVNSQAVERLSFPTQKPEELLERIIESSSCAGDLIADFFCGSGTSVAVAERKNRRWIGCDFGKVALQITRNRLVQMNSKPFLLENIGNYQRQLIYLSGQRINEIQRIILKLYGATPRKDQLDLGTKRERDREVLVYVSYPDRPITAKRVDDIEVLAERLDGRGFDRLVILGWDYEYNFDELLRERKLNSKRHWRIEPECKTIPPEVYDYLRQIKSEDQIDSVAGKIRFNDKPFLKLLEPKIERNGKNATITVGVERFVIFEYPVEEPDQRKEIDSIVAKDPLALIDYMAVDWNYDGITFKSGWQAFRQHGRKIEPIPRKVSQVLPAGRAYTVAIRVVDVFGNDASKTTPIDLR